jgi:aquaporin Z
MKLEHWREYLIEAWGLGTFMVSAGVFATLLYSPNSPIWQIIPNEFLRGLIMGIAMGLTAIAIIYSPWGKRSGAHINPAVTITFFRLKKITLLDTLGYIFAQFVGGLLGVLLVAAILRNLFTNPPVNYVVTVPGSWGLFAALAAEFILSLVLMLMVLVTSNNDRLSKYTGIFAGILVATYITFEAPISGMSINPARTFASALPAQIWTAFWIYYFAPPLAMLLAAEIYLRYRGKPKTICYKLCPNGEQPCIATKCCGSCDKMIRYWRKKHR